VAHVALGAEFSAATGWKKLGQPVPESNFTFERNNGSPLADAGIDVAFAVVMKEAAERALGTVGARNAILIGHRASVCIIGFMMRRRCFCHEKRSIARYIK
jgi:hypothetical protein